ncbi:hypothetical protein CBE37_01175 [bacterium TMED277]|nr:MAG: hypothetical protein CBE37_01175 [bacterium TMED277]
MWKIKYKLFQSHSLLYIICLYTIIIFPSKTIVTAAEFTINLKSYSYEEVDSANQFFMSDKSSSPFFGFGVREWDLGAFGDRDSSSLWKLLYTIEYSEGRVNYTSNGTGTMVKDYYRGRLETYLSKEIYVNKKRARPYIGLGYRQLFDNSANQVTSTGAIGYNRISQYYFLPLGMIWYINDSWSLKSQYNYLLQGKQTSYVKDAIPATYNVNPVNTQSIGGGLDFTLNKKLTSNWYYYGFIRHWDLGASDAVSCSASSNCVEPKNSTNEIGVGISFTF